MTTESYTKTTNQTATCLRRGSRGVYTEITVHVLEFVTEFMASTDQTARYMVGTVGEGGEVVELNMGGTYATPGEVLALVAKSDARARAEQAGEVAAVTRVIYDDDARPSVYDNRGGVSRGYRR